MTCKQSIDEAISAIEQSLTEPSAPEGSTQQEHTLLSIQADIQMLLGSVEGDLCQLTTSSLREISGRIKTCFAQPIHKLEHLKKLLSSFLSMVLQLGAEHDLLKFTALFRDPPKFLTALISSHLRHHGGFLEDTKKQAEVWKKIHIEQLQDPGNTVFHAVWDAKLKRMNIHPEAYKALIMGSTTANNIAHQSPETKADALRDLKLSVHLSNTVFNQCLEKHGEFSASYIVELIRLYENVPFLLLHPEKYRKNR